MIRTIFEKVFDACEHISQEEEKVLKPYIDKGLLKKKNKTYQLDTRYRVGRVQMHNRTFMFEPFDKNLKPMRLHPDHLNGSSVDDTVIVKRVFNPRSQVKAQVVEVLESSRGEFLAYYSQQKWYDFKTNSVLSISSKQTNFRQGDVILYNKALGTVSETIGNLNDPMIDEKLSLYSYVEQNRFKYIDVKESMFSKKNLTRTDLRELDFCTIDPSSAKDHDDAIYFDDKYDILYVAIADVSHFVKEGSALDKLALQRSVSAYFPHKVFPMLPSLLSEELCSLKPNVDRFAYVFKMFLDVSTMNVIKSEYFEAIICSKAKYSYGRIDRVLKGHRDQCSKQDHRIFDSLIKLYTITQSFRNNRLKKGFDFRSETVKPLLSSNGDLKNVNVESSTPSHQLVEECMLLTNIQASLALKDKGIYRNHQEPSLKSVTRLTNELALLGLPIKMKSDLNSTIKEIQKRSLSHPMRYLIDELIIQSQTQADYASTKLGHFGLGFSSYSHFTSPIRRYSDLILHRLLKQESFESDLDAMITHINAQERKIDQMVWDFEERKFARWAKKNLNSRVEAYIVDTVNGIAKTNKPYKGIRIKVKNYKGETLLSKVYIELVSADIVNKTIIGIIRGSL